jgi:hypothetical protein
MAGDRQRRTAAEAEAGIRTAPITRTDRVAIRSGSGTRDKLRAFIAEYAGPDDHVDDTLAAIEGAIQRYVELDSKPDIRKQARRLEKAAAKYRKAVQESEQIWAWMLDGRNGPDAWGVNLAEAKKVEAAARGVADWLKGKKGGDPDDLRLALGRELTDIFAFVTGEPATSSGSADFESGHPGTLFGHFVHLALSDSAFSSTPRVRELVQTVASFVRDAKNRQQFPFGEERLEK